MRRQMNDLARISVGKKFTWTVVVRVSSDEVGYNIADEIHHLP